jgi:hypothetical protein
VTRLTLRGLAARKLRTALTAMAVVLGVAMISGTYVLTDTIDRAFGEVFAEGNARTDVVVSPGRDAPDTATGQEVGLDAALVDRVRAVPQVAAVEGEVLDIGITVVGADGEPLSRAGPPILGGSATPDSRFTVLTPTEGRLPSADGEVAVDTQLAEDQGFAVGDTLRIAGDAGARDYRLAGIARYGTSGSIAGASLIAFTPAEAQRVLGKGGRFDQLSVAAADGVSTGAARAAVARALRGEAVTVRTGTEEGRAEAADLQEEFSFLRTALLIFAGSRSSSARSSSTTRSRSRSPSAPASSRCCAPSARRAGRSCAPSCSRPRSSGSSPRCSAARGLLVAPGIVACSARSGSSLPTTDTVVRARRRRRAARRRRVTVVASVAPAPAAHRQPAGRRDARRADVGRGAAGARGS